MEVRIVRLRIVGKAVRNVPNCFQAIGDGLPNLPAQDPLTARLTIAWFSRKLSCSHSKESIARLHIRLRRTPLFVIGS
jgi:hypothetical protein